MRLTTTRKFMIALLSASFSFWPAFSAEPEPGEISFRLDGTPITLAGAQAVTVEKDNGALRLIIAANDPAQKLKFQLAAMLPAGFEEQGVSSEYQDLVLTIKRDGAAVMIMPAASLAEAGDLTYAVKPGARDQATRASQARVRPDWEQMTRAERLRAGRGVSVNNQARGTVLRLHIRPIYTDGVLTEIRGSFAGRGRGGARGGAQWTLVQNGQFRLPVTEAR